MSARHGVVNHVARRRSRSTETVRRSSAIVALPTTDAQTARPARKPEAPARQASRTASGKTSAGTPEDSTTQGLAMDRAAGAAGDDLAGVPLPGVGTSAL